MNKIVAAIAAAFLVAPLFALGQSTGLQVSVNENGLQALTYNGQNFLQFPMTSGNIIISRAEFIAPDGTNKAYGWGGGSLDNGAFTIQNATQSFTTNPISFTHTYRPGASDSLTAKVTYTIIDARTLRIDTAITNNDANDTLSGVSFYANFLPLQTPGPANQYNQNVPIVLSPVALNGGYPVAFLSGTWGSLAVWMPDYTTSQNVRVFYGSADQAQFGFYLENYSCNQVNHCTVDKISPHATRTLTEYLRFGSSSDTATTLAPEGFNLMRQAFPYLVNWPDRRPIAQLMVANGVYPSWPLNPRGYFGDSRLDVSNQTNFTARLMRYTDKAIAVMNVMDPRPQGINIWDLEGNEFYQYFTYVGNQPKLHDMAPEMDAAVDRMMTKFRSAGYRIGMTLRPSTYMTGTTLPSTCSPDVNNGDPATDPDTLHEVFIKTDAQPPYRGYVCTAPNVWSQLGHNQPYFQTVYNDGAKTLAILEEKVRYAKQRWGATIFYVDSTVYTTGGSFSFNIFRQLEKDFPDTLFMPENEDLLFSGATAPYNESRQGVFRTFQNVRDVYPQAFSAIFAFGVDYSNAANYNNLVNAVKDGNILFVQGWWSNPDNQYILKAYRDAGRQ